LPRIRASEDDFEVEEVALFEPCGEGGHTLVQVEKRAISTVDVAQALARFAHARYGDVGFAGRKDCRAVARQWFSVPGLDPDLALAWGGDDGFRVLAAHRHRHKLRVGQLTANRFRITIRDVSRQQASLARQRLSSICELGMSNRFGAQRFGRGGENVARGKAILRGDGTAGSKRHRRFLLSALQSALFNEVLARRPVASSELLAGDVAVVHASGGQFIIDDPQREADRARRFEISPTGPIFGSKMKPAGGVVLDLEQRVLRDWDLTGAFDRPPRGLRLRGGRRPLRVRPEDTECSLAADSLTLRFTLPAGSFATVLVEDLFPDSAIEEVRG
jgi:tRNA pseudouridine13 synthase